MSKDRKKFEKRSSSQQRPNRQKPQNRPVEPVEEVEEERDLVAGRLPAIEVLKSERDINKIFIQEGLSGSKMNEIQQLAKKRSVQVSFVPKAKLDQLVDGVNHQGVVIAAAAFQYATIDDLFAAAAAKGEEPFFIILDGVEDPHNLGSIMRTADASGAHGMIIPKRRAVGLTATVAKASTGAIEHVPVARVTNLTQTINELKERGVWLYGTDMEGQDYRQWETNLPIGLVIGNEGKGISRLVKEQMDGMVTIPMTGHVQSLNASVAASLLMYEVFRGRSAK
ncbi:MAG: 23S rRNA (guanosine(2251)-2'-O)-methyltransferase RlmB [Carnobacterium sp.]|uniref:23S rRNA (Guanosine(2251)-2'-O)-methyltransferase RlmB n=1 Tax=Carnobacterium antarcticum TaxID=2126436 RepID=A0ABW4NL64_9LACT|nr:MULTISPECIES: 23S rRNA (guanosine(2251)-2'-O)-methyltransferase RlmB [unclassified Carnobacterium]ALV22305.1 23S rRNA (guanosine-2'-O-) -methyltransferase rlmB [Carnobacterium sp. CP1]QQP70252.1 23S rRNA (guanosine(2251)-2'-O)-methyltransferase RlmB [Carnobacterium sp. CS13]